MSRMLEWNWSPMALACWMGCASWLYVYIPPQKKIKSRLNTLWRNAHTNTKDTIQHMALIFHYFQHWASVRNFIPLHNTSPSVPPALLWSSPAASEKKHHMYIKKSHKGVNIVNAHSVSTIYLQYIGDDISFTLLEERIFVKWRIHLQNLC